MTAFRRAAAIVLALLYLGSIFAGWLAPAGYARQFREMAGAPPSRAFLLGADELGRDSFARLLYGSRISLTLAPAAALFSTALAAAAGIAAGSLGGWLDALLMRAADLFLSVPWLFLLLTARALLPLNVPAGESAVITFALLGLLGWAGPARVVRAATRDLKTRDFMIQARARGCERLRLVVRHLAPNLWPVLAAQFWISVPLFILSEANLSFLGLGVGEPLPSWGNLITGLASPGAIGGAPWRLAPLILLVLAMTCFHTAFPEEKFSK